MGAGEFLSSRAYNSYVRNERDREAWELENYPAGEIAEMVELFVARGMSREDAEFVIQRSARACPPPSPPPPPSQPAPPLSGPRHRRAAAPASVCVQWPSTRIFSST